MAAVWVHALPDDAGMGGFPTACLPAWAPPHHATRVPWR